MGISTIQSYCGAQIFEAVGLDRELIDAHFTGTASRIGGIGLEELADRGAGAPLPRLPAHRPRDCLPVGGVLQWRRDGELHIWNPDTIATLQRAVRRATADAWRTYEEFARLANDDATRKAALRGLMKLRTRPSRFRSTRSSRRRRSSSGSPPAR